MSKPKSATPGVIGYCRVSTEEQAVSGLGMESQLLAIEAEAAKRDLPLLHVYQDPGVSGKTLKRPGLSDALAALELGQGSILMVAKLDRLSRSVHDATGLMQRAEKQGWGLVALDAHVDTTTPQGAAMTQVLAVFAELERRLIGQRTKDALAVKKAQGVRLGRPRGLPDDVVDRIIRDRAAGLSWSEISRQLNAEEVPTAQKGKNWHPATVRLIAMRGPS